MMLTVGVPDRLFAADEKDEYMSFATLIPLRRMRRIALSGLVGERWSMHLTQPCHWNNGTRGLGLGNRNRSLSERIRDLMSLVSGHR